MPCARLCLRCDRRERFIISFLSVFSTVRHFLISKSPVLPSSHPPSLHFHPPQIPALVLQPAARPALSPRLMEASTWALARWCDTYLLPEEPLPGTLQV